MEEGSWPLLPRTLWSRSLAVLRRLAKAPDPLLNARLPATGALPFALVTRAAAPVAHLFSQQGGP